MVLTACSWISVAVRGDGFACGNQSRVRFELAKYIYYIVGCKG